MTATIEVAIPLRDIQGWDTKRIEARVLELADLELQDLKLRDQVTEILPEVTFLENDSNNIHHGAAIYTVDVEGITYEQYILAFENH
jgi:hypothetical protein